jgi:hypothetical protein
MSSGHVMGVLEVVIDVNTESMYLRDEFVLLPMTPMNSSSSSQQ